MCLQNSNKAVHCLWILSIYSKLIYPALENHIIFCTSCFHGILLHVPVNSQLKHDVLQDIKNNEAYDEFYSEVRRECISFGMVKFIVCSKAIRQLILKRCDSTKEVMHNLLSKQTAVIKAIVYDRIFYKTRQMMNLQ